MAVSDRYRAMAADFTSRVEAVPPDRWESPSPCEGWTARDVVRHMVGNVDWFFGMIGRARPDGPSVDDDPAGAWAAARDAMQAALDDPQVAGAEYEGAFGRSTLEQSVDRFMCIDLLVHAWDLARAAGLDERLDADEVHRVFEAVQPMDEMLRSPQAFGPKVEPPEDADEQARLLAFLGRNPG
ncbi:MAG TPA: TIGR03086 family metal-binding protein [Acidimicrobiales bacterium]|nr:TIGR03086 family metal-binding protein [Acidimicrobiales bacterium]